jgi:CheY-like chemotaxis protein
VLLHGLRVLVVDDASSVRSAVKRFLTGYGAIVTTEASAVAALATLVRERPDVLLSDIAMPDFDGFWLIEQVRSLPECDGGATPAVAITAKDTADRGVLLKAGFQEHVPKPFDPDHLASVVGSLARPG